MTGRLTSVKMTQAGLSNGKYCIWRLFGVPHAASKGRRSDGSTNRAESNHSIRLRAFDTMRECNVTSFVQLRRPSARPVYRHGRLLSWISFLIFVCATGHVIADDGENGEPEALAALAQGGQVIYLRHTERGSGPKEKLSATSTSAEYADCSRQRNLTVEGRQQARVLGQAWRELGIPVGKVYANVQCRTRETALLAFGRAALEPKIFDVNYVRQLLLQRPTDKTNTIVVGSDSQLRDLTGIQLGYGEAALVVPDGRGGVQVAATLELEDWPEAVAADQEASH